MVVPKNIDFEVVVQVHEETLPGICEVLTEGVNKFNSSDLLFG